VNGWGPAQWSANAPFWRHQPWGTTGGDTYNPRHYLDARSVARLRHPQNYVMLTYTYVPDPIADMRGYRTREEIGREAFDLGFGGWESLGTRGS
jgi:hypothetical protein